MFAALPADILEELSLLKQKYSDDLTRADKGMVPDDAELKALDRRMGMILVREARKPLGVRTVRMAALALGIHRFFPELRLWKERQLRSAERAAVERLVRSGGARSECPRPRPGRGIA